MINAAELKEMLNARAEEVCQELLSAGKREGQEWAVGDLSNAEGKSLRICVAGPKIGIWHDFVDGDGGSNLLELWRQVRGLSFEEARGEIMEFLNIRQPAFKRVTAEAVNNKKSAPQDKLKDLSTLYTALKEGGPVYSYLREERSLSDDALKRYRIGESLDGKAIAFPYFSAEGRLGMIKFLALERDKNGKKKVWSTPNGAPQLLFGIHAIGEEFSELVITEGEIDAMSMWDYGQPAVSLPFGAGAGKDSAALQAVHQKWVEHDFDWLEQFVNIWLGLDMDEAGRRAIKPIAIRLDEKRCKIIEYPGGHKDANACLVAGVDVDDIWKALSNAKNMDPELLKQPSDFRKEVFQAFWPEDGKEPGEEFWWDFPFMFRPKEVTLWHGFTKHGKTQLLNHLLCWIGHKYGKRSCVASMEMHPSRTVQNMGRQIMGKQKPHDEDEFNRMITWLDQWIFFYSHVGTAPVDDILQVFEYAAKKYGVKHFVIDSLMKTDVNEEDNESQKIFLNRLSKFARDFDVHVHLVAHSKKPDSKHPEKKYYPPKYGVRGSAHIVDLPDNVICLWRNKGKEEKINDIEDEEDRNAMIDELADEKDALLVVQGQRLNGDEPIKNLWFDKISWQFRPKWSDERTCYLAKGPKE